MKKKFLRLNACAFLLLMTACSHKYYTADNIAQYNIKTIAVLPVAMDYTGTMPKNVTAADLAKKAEIESTMFQRSVYASILNNINKKKKPSSIQFQSTSKTVQLLASNNISITQAWTEDPMKLAQLLGVDAVVKMNVTTSRYMSDAASAGFSVLNDVLGSIKGKVPVGNAPTKTNDITVNCSLVEKNNGIAVWNDKYTEEANWQNQPQEVIDAVTRKFGKHFPAL